MDAYLHICIQIYKMRYRRNQCCEYAQGWAVRGAHPERKKIIFSLLHKRPDWLWDPPSYQPHGYKTGFFLMEAKLSGGEFDYLQPSSAEVEGSIPPLPYMPSRGARDNITLYVVAYMCAYRVSCLSN